MVKKVLKESVSSGNYQLVPTEDSVMTDELSNLIDISVYPKFSGVPIPWDLDIRTEGNQLVLDGYAGPSGQGSAVVKIPLKDAKNYVILQIDNITNEDEYNKIQIAAINNGWIFRAKR